MSITIDAIYEAGLLKPVELLRSVQEHALVKLTIEPASHTSSRAGRDLVEVLDRIDRRREAIFSAALIREGREQELE